MTTAQIMKELESQITEKDIEEQVASYKRIIKTCIIKGDTVQAEIFSLKLLNVYNLTK